MGCSTAEIFAPGPGLGCPFAGVTASVPGFADFTATAPVGFAVLLLVAGVAGFAATLGLPVLDVPAVGFCAGVLADDFWFAATLVFTGAVGFAPDLAG
jgi:hypothetical protein